MRFLFSFFFFFYFILFIKLSGFAIFFMFFVFFFFNFFYFPNLLVKLFLYFFSPKECYIYHYSQKLWFVKGERGGVVVYRKGFVNDFFFFFSLTKEFLEWMSVINIFSFQNIFKFIRGVTSDGDSRDWTALTRSLSNVLYDLLIGAVQ